MNPEVLDDRNRVAQRCHDRERVIAWSERRECTRASANLRGDGSENERSEACRVVLTRKAARERVQPALKSTRIFCAILIRHMGQAPADVLNELFESRTTDPRR